MPLFSTAQEIVYTVKLILKALRYVLKHTHVRSHKQVVHTRYLLATYLYYYIMAYSSFYNVVFKILLFENEPKFFR